jgi:hypothetical protein
MKNMASQNHSKCRGCGKELDKTAKNVVQVRLGEISKHRGKSPVFKPKDNSTWGYMHERCFLIAIGDPKGIELLAS